MDIFKDNSSQKEKFRIAGNKLLNKCFLIKKREDMKSDYMFVIQNKQKFEEYFDMLGYSIELNEGQGIIALRNNFNSGRLRLKKLESIILLIFRLLYVEKRKEISLNQEVVILMDEFHQKYNMLNIKQKPMLDKTILKNLIQLFKKYNLIYNIDKDITMSEARIKIYPSIMLAITNEDLNKAYIETKDKLNKYTIGDIENEEEVD